MNLETITKQYQNIYELDSSIIDYKLKIEKNRFIQGDDNHIKIEISLLFLINGFRKIRNFNLVSGLLFRVMHTPYVFKKKFVIQIALL